MTAHPNTSLVTTTDSSDNDGGNKYVSKKTIAQGMFDVALLSSNTNQLVHLLESESQGQSGSAFRLTAIALLIISIILQVIVGGCLLFIAMMNSRTRRLIRRRLDTISTLLVFFITVINILIPAFTPSYYIQKP